MSPAGATWISRRGVDLAYVGTCLLFLVAPFERLQPLVSLPGQKVTTVEAAVLLVAAGWCAVCAVSRPWPACRTPIALPLDAWLGVATIATALAQAFQLNALKTLGRLGLGWFVVLLPFNGVTSPARMTRVVWCATASAVVVAIVATLESMGVPVVMRWLEDFRQGVRVVGGQVRAGGTLQYPTIASMYLEIVFALALGAFLHAMDRRSMTGAADMFVALAIIAAGIAVTLTRSGLITMAFSLAAVGAARFARRGWDRGAVGLGALSVAVVLVVTSAASAQCGSAGVLLRRRHAGGR